FLGAAAGANEILARFREHSQDADLALRERPAEIVRQLPAPFVVFGHTHHAREIKLPGGSTYFNTGTWVAGQKPGLLRAFTHVMIRLDAGGTPGGKLCQWRDGASLAFI